MALSIGFSDDYFWRTKGGNLLDDMQENIRGVCLAFDLRIWYIHIKHIAKHLPFLIIYKFAFYGDLNYQGLQNTLSNENTLKICIVKLLSRH